MAKTWDELIAERKGIPLEEYREQKRLEEKLYKQEQLKEDIIDFTKETIAPAVVFLIVFFIVVKVIKKEFFHARKAFDIPDENESKAIIDKKFSMKWFNILTRYLIPFSVIVSPIITFGDLHLDVSYYYGSWFDYLGNMLNALSLSMYIFMLILLIIANKELRKYSYKGYKLIMIFFALSILSPIIEMLLYFDYGYSLGKLIVALLVFIPNIIYFKKRKHLFTEKGVIMNEH